MRIAVVFTLGLALTVVAACASAPSTGRAAPSRDVPVGVATIDITPEEPIRLSGYGNRVAPYTAIGQRLWAKALAFGRDDQRPAVLITADVIGIPRSMTEEVALRLRTVKVERPQLAISASHTHTGPSIAGVLPHIFSTPVTGDQQTVIDRYSRELTDKLERVARAALADRRPARMMWGRGTARFAAHRRVVKDGKWVAFGVNPTGPVDHDLPVLTVRSPDGVLRGVLINYACHATTLGGNDNVVHGDWPGMAQAIIQQRHPGAVAMVTIGTGADANPNPRGNGLPDVERHASEVAAEVDRVLAGGSGTASPNEITRMSSIGFAPVGQLRDLDIAFSRIPTRQEWEKQSTQKGASGAYARAVLQGLDRGEQVPPSVRYAVQTWTFGDDLAMVFLAGEVVSEYGLRLKREVDGTRLWVNAYSNDVPFYVASRRMIPEGGYEVESSMVFYGQPASLAESTEDRIIAGVRELLPPAFSRK